MSEPPTCRICECEYVPREAWDNEPGICDPCAQERVPQLERELAEANRERNQWREVAEQFYKENEGNWPGYHSAPMKAFRKLMESSK